MKDARHVGPLNTVVVQSNATVGGIGISPPRDGNGIGLTGSHRDVDRDELPLGVPAN